MFGSWSSGESEVAIQTMAALFHGQEQPQIAHLAILRAWRVSQEGCITESGLSVVSTGPKVASDYLPDF